MEPIITAQTIMAAFMTLTTTNVDSADYCYNADINDQQVKAIEIYDRHDDDMLTAKARRQYTYDGQDRLLTRETQLWDARKHQWIPADCQYYTYDGTGVNIELRRWDKRTDSYSKPVEMTRYEYLAANVTSVERSRWNARKDAYRSSEKMLLMSSVPDYDMAFNR